MRDALTILIEERDRLNRAIEILAAGEDSEPEVPPPRRLTKKKA